MRLAIAIFVVALGTASCGGDGAAPGSGDAAVSDSGTSGVEKTKIWSGLTTTEKGAVCDWISSLYGGYGMTIDCNNGLTVGSNTSQQACIDSVPATCAATVGEIEQCSNLAKCPDPTPGLACLITACQ